MFRTIYINLDRKTIKSFVDNDPIFTFAWKTRYSNFAVFLRRIWKRFTDIGNFGFKFDQRVYTKLWDQEITRRDLNLRTNKNGGENFLFKAELISKTSEMLQPVFSKTNWTNFAFMLAGRAPQSNSGTLTIITNFDFPQNILALISTCHW